MNCTEAELYISSVYDGEESSPGAAEHIAACERCRGILGDYSRMGAELRLAARMEEAGQLRPLPLPSRTRWLDVLWRGVSVPRLALAALIACLVLATAAVSIVRAQARPLWFQFGYGLRQGGEPLHYVVARQGYDDTLASLNFVRGAPLAAALRVKVESVAEGDVVLRCRAVPARTESTAGGIKLLGGPEGGVSLDAAPTVHYKPGEALAIPVEGGGTLYLKGDVLDHQPRIAFGQPLEPSAEKLIVRSPVLTSAGELLGELSGATAIAGNETEGVELEAGTNGTYRFALHPFPGAVEGEANWGEITFKLAEQEYRLMAAAPMTGGDQPRTVWVRREAASGGRVALGAGPTPKI